MAIPGSLRHMIRLRTSWCNTQLTNVFNLAHGEKMSPEKQYASASGQLPLLDKQ